jgi:DNA-binding MarR family transcriptional regulator
VNPGTSVLFDVYALGQAIGRVMAAAMAGAPISPREYALYSAIFELESATPSELATRLGMPLTTLMDQLADVERRGHARRIRNPRDGRSYLLVLSAEGLAAHRAANRLFEAAYDDIVRRLPAGEAGAKAALADLRAAVDGAARRFERVAVSPRPTAGRAG